MRWGFQEVEGDHIFRLGIENVLYTLYAMSMFRGIYLCLEAPPAADFTPARKLCRWVKASRVFPKEDQAIFLTGAGSFHQSSSSRLDRLYQAEKDRQLDPLLQDLAFITPAWVLPERF